MTRTNRIFPNLEGWNRKNETSIQRLEAAGNGADERDEHHQADHHAVGCRLPAR